MYHILKKNIEFSIYLSSWLENYLPEKHCLLKSPQTDWLLCDSRPYSLSHGLLRRRCDWLIVSVALMRFA